MQGCFLCVYIITACVNIAFLIVKLGIGIKGLIKSLEAAVMDQSFTAITGIEEAVNFMFYVCTHLFVILSSAHSCIGTALSWHQIGLMVLCLNIFHNAASLALGISGALKATNEKDEILGSLRPKSNFTIHQTPYIAAYLDTWNIVQRNIECCGVESYRDWLDIKWYNSTTKNVVPGSCCKRNGFCDSAYITESDILLDVDMIHNLGCVGVVNERIKDKTDQVHALTTVAVVIQCFGLVTEFIVFVCGGIYHCCKDERRHYDMI